MKSARPGYCTRHQADIKQRLHFLGLWKHVKGVDAETAIDIAQAWLAGRLKREYLCPLVVLMLEIQAKANRLADQVGGTHGAQVTTCPCCAIVRMSNDPAADVKVIRGMGDVVLGLMQSNGLVGGAPAASLTRIDEAPEAISRIALS